MPLGAVFTEQDPETKQMTRFVYVKKEDETFERRPVQIGINDYDYAEVLSGLNVGEVVSLELPPGETAAPIAQQRPAGSGPMSISGNRLGTGPTNGSAGARSGFGGTSGGGQGSRGAGGAERPGSVNRRSSSDSDR